MSIDIRKAVELQVRPRIISSAVEQRKSLRDTETRELFVNPLQIMTPSEKVWQVLARGILTRLFILWLLTEIRRDINDDRQERSAMKRGPEENYDDCSSKGNFEVKSIQLCRLFREIALTENFRDKSYHPKNL